MADAKISALPIASISSSDIVPFTKVSTSVTSGTAYNQFFRSPSILGDMEAAQNITAGSVIGVNLKVGGGIGYITGSGSIVGQGTGGRSVTIVSNAPTGALVLTSSVMSASIISSFIVANSVMGVNDFMLIQHISGGTPGIYTFAQSTLGGGNTLIKMRNNQNAAITEALTIGYVVIKGAQS